MASVRVENIWAEFPIYSATGRSLKKQLLRTSTGGRISSDTGRVVVQALNGLSLELEHGDRLGLVGHNGAGKTTLLRILAGVYEPTRGNVRVEGHITPLLDIGLGIDPEATGYENIFLRGALLGINRRELARLTAEIAEFTELGDYLSMPVRTYSSGMTLRLAFGISTSVTPEILLMDEYFAVGDAHFLHKAEKRLDELASRAGVLVLASHSRELVCKLCNRVAWLETGQIRKMGPAEEIAKEYFVS